MRKILTAVLLSIAIYIPCTAAQVGLPPLVIPDCLGVNIHFAGRDMAQVNKIADVGFRLIRMDFAWGGIETKRGEYNFKAYDELFDSLASRGIRPVFILDYGNPLYGDDQPNKTDAGRVAFAAFAKAGAAHFKGKGIIWEIWNEPNIEGWSPKPVAEDYVKLAKVTYAAIKQADPDSIVIGPASCGSWTHKWIENAFKAGLLEYVDAVSVHPYGCKRPEDASVYYTWLRWKIGQYAPKGVSRPILSGEWGYPSLPSSSFGDGVTLEGQADFLPRMFLVNVMNGCHISIWYDWRDDGVGSNPGDREFNFGTLYNDFKEKPVHFAMKTLYAELNGYSFVRRISVGSNSDYIVLLRKGNDYRIAAWTTVDAHAISIPVDSQSVTIVSLAGEKKRVETKNGTLEISLTGSVQYIEPTNPSRRWALDTNWNK